MLINEEKKPIKEFITETKQKPKEFIDGTKDNKLNEFITPPKKETKPNQLNS